MSSVPSHMLFPLSGLSFESFFVRLISVNFLRPISIACGVTFAQLPKVDLFDSFLWIFVGDLHSCLPHQHNLILISFEDFTFCGLGGCDTTHLQG